MYNFGNKKNNKMVTGIIIVLIITMVLSTLVAAIM